MKALRNNIYATKKDLTMGILKLKKEIKSSQFYLDYKIETYKKEMDEFKSEFMDFKDKVLTNLDWLVGAFKKFEEEHTILSGQYSNINIKLDNHESRIVLLESK